MPKKIFNSNRVNTSEFLNDHSTDWYSGRIKQLTKKKLPSVRTNKTYKKKFRQMYINQLKKIVATRKKNRKKNPKIHHKSTTSTDWYSDRIKQLNQQNQ